MPNLPSSFPRRREPTAELLPPGGLTGSHSSVKSQRLVLAQRHRLIEPYDEPTLRLSPCESPQRNPVRGRYLRPYEAHLAAQSETHRGLYSTIQCRPASVV